jgi:cysteine desulfurase
MKIKKLRNQLIEGILKIPNTKLNGPKENRLCNNINICFNNIEGEAIGGYLDAYGISGSTGSACSSHTLESSHVLKAIGLNDLQANTSIRLSLSKYNTEKEIDYVLEVLNKVVIKLRKMSPIK